LNASRGLFRLAEVDDFLEGVDDPLVRSLDLIAPIDLLGVLARPDGGESRRVVEAIERMAESATVARDLGQPRDDLLLAR
jgi:hypothetical protein